MKSLFTFILLFSFQVCLSQFIGKSYSECLTNIPEYKTILTEDTIFATHETIKTRVVLIFENDICYQNIEYHAYFFLKSYMESAADKWKLKGQLPSGGLLFENDSLYMAIEFQQDYFTANIITKEAYLR